MAEVWHALCMHNHGIQHRKKDDVPAAAQDLDQAQQTGGKTEHKLVMSDRYGQATMSATLHEDGRIEAQTESTAAEEGSCSALAASVTAAGPTGEGPVSAETKHATSPGQAAPPAQAASGEMAASEDSREAGSGSGAEGAPEISAIAAAMQQDLAQEQGAEHSTTRLAAAASNADMDARSAPEDDLAASTAA